MSVESSGRQVTNRMNDPIVEDTHAFRTGPTARFGNDTDAIST